MFELKLGEPLLKTCGLCWAFACEYAALAAAGSLHLVTRQNCSLRGAMQEGAVGAGAMAAILMVMKIKLTPILQRQDVGLVEIANDNAPGQIVSGAANAVDKAITEAKAAGLRRAIKLPVSAPFHCGLMRQRSVMRKALAASQSMMLGCRYFVSSPRPPKHLLITCVIIWSRR